MISIQTKMHSKYVTDLYNIFFLNPFTFNNPEMKFNKRYIFIKAFYTDVLIFIQPFFTVHAKNGIWITHSDI